MASITGDDAGSGFGVKGTSLSGIGILALSDQGIGIGGGSKAGDAVRAVSISGRGVFALAGGDAVVGQSGKSRGVVGISRDRAGVSGESHSDNGVLGRTEAGSAAGLFGLNQAAGGGNGVAGVAEGLGGIGVYGRSEARGVGVVGSGAKGMNAIGDVGPGIEATSAQSDGVQGTATQARSAGVRGRHSGSGIGVAGDCERGIGVVASGHHGLWGMADPSDSISCGVVATSGAAPFGTWQPTGAALCAASDDTWKSAISATTTAIVLPAISGDVINPAGLGPGVRGSGPFCGIEGAITSSGSAAAYLIAAVRGSAKYNGHVAVQGIAEWSATGVMGLSENGAAVCGISSGEGTAVYGFSPHPTNVGGLGFAGYFHGAVNVTGPVHKSGGGFLIDHPCDPEGKFLSHSFVESDERKNIYDGVVELNPDGASDVQLPAWFSALNCDFRYQLTALGGPAPNLHIAREVEAGTLRIEGGQPHQRVCWQVTGRRRDAWAEANPQAVEVEKSDGCKGLFRHPELFGHGDTKSIDRVRRDLESRAAPAREPDDPLVQALFSGRLPEEVANEPEA